MIIHQIDADSEDNDPCSHTVHAGNVLLLWMRCKAAAHGLVFEPNEFSWDPEDVKIGRRDSMKFRWKIAEVLPFHHQVSFSGTGKHKWQ